MGEKFQWTPDWLTVDHGGRRRYNDANEGCHSESNRDGEELRPKCISRLSCKTGKIRIIHNQRGKIGNGAHYATNDFPSVSAPFESAALLDYRTNAMRSHDSPDEEREPSQRYKVCFDGKEMPDLVDRKPYRRQTAKPKEKETDKISGISSRALHGIGNVIPRVPYRSNHQVHACSTNP